MRLIKMLLSMPKTILFNFKVFPFKAALKLPILVAYNVKINNMHKGCVLIDPKASRFMIRINFENGSNGINVLEKGYFDIGKKGRVIFKGKANFSKGVSIRVDNGDLTFGDNFYCNRNCFFSCTGKVTIGDNALLGWNVNIRDSDGHDIFNLNNPNIITNTLKPVTIGEHVWIAANVDILKGSSIPDNCIIGYNSCVTKKFVDKNCIIGGYPAKVVKENVNWR